MNVIAGSRIISLCAGTAMLIALSGCETSGGARLAGVGSADGAASSNGSDGSGAAAGSSGDGSGAATAGGSANAGGSGGSSGVGTSSGSANGSGGGTADAGDPAQRPLGVIPAALVTTGNALLGTGQSVDAAGAGTLGAPVTGTIARVLDGAGQTLVTTATGEQILVEGLRGRVGDAVAIVPAIAPAITGSAGINGTGASVAAGPGGNTILATVNGLPNRVVSGISGASPLGALNLPVGGAVAGANVAGAAVGGSNGLVTAGILNPAPGQGSLATANILPGTAGSPAASVATAPLAGAAGAVTGAAGSVPEAVAGIANATVANTTIGSPGLIGAGVLSPAPSSGTVATVTALPGNGAPAATVAIPALGGVLHR